MTSFEKAVNLIIKLEGGSKVHTVAGDPGGTTRWGISTRAHGGDVSNLSRDDAIQIYRVEYWDACRLDDISLDLRLPIFDCAVNQGVRTAGKLLQRALNDVGEGLKVDGHIGPRTIMATISTDAEAVRVNFLARRATRYAATKGFKKFGRGWMRRLMRIACA